ncbi:hypothetical protein BHE74_00028752 [Ensete ventricosum]|nr:hypothetical protein BHE74_00028752 [Ensete ventricosum]
MESLALSRPPPPRLPATGRLAPPAASFRLHHHYPGSHAGSRRGPLGAADALPSSSSAAHSFQPEAISLSRPLKSVSVDSLQYESGYLGGISEKTNLSLPPSGDVGQNGALNPMEYLTSVLTSRVYDVAIESPLQLAPKLSARLGVDLWLKREDLQPVMVFSFKLRGAYNMMAKLPREQLDRGVICSSAGNHAQGVALAAQRLGCDAVIVMPVTTPEIKFPTFSYLDEKPVDTGLMKFSGLCPSAVSWYLEFAFAFSTSSTPFTTNALPP